ncbi:MAG: phage tail protein [Fusobacterium periodonticum]|nr:phage tail protein [Fusobacterium periodonticum]
MKFNGITKKGREYLAKIQAENKPINFAKIKIGDGRLDNYDNPAELEHLINQKVEKGILTLNQEHDTVILTTNIDNVSLRTGYYPREIGVFVNDNGQEIMYYYMNDGDETSWIPPETDGPFKIELKLNLIASNAQSIIVEGSGKDLYITKEFLETNYTQKGGYTGTAQEIDDRVVSALGKEDGKFPLIEAVKGNVYYFPGNKKFYICKEAQNRRVSVPDGNFEELSIWENRKRLENLNRNWKILWQGISHEVQFYTTNIGANINFDNIFSLTIVGNTTCTIPGVLLKKLAINQELIIGHDNAVRSDAVFFFKKISNTFGIFGTRGVAEDIHLHGYNTLIIEY